MPYEGAWRTGVAQGREDERERIIKLLEFYLGETDWSNFEGDSPSVEWIRGFSAALALIKGEK